MKNKLILCVGNSNSIFKNGIVTQAINIKPCLKNEMAKAFMIQAQCFNELTMDGIDFVIFTSWLTLSDYTLPFKARGQAFM